MKWIRVTLDGPGNEPFSMFFTVTKDAEQVTLLDVAEFTRKAVVSEASANNYTLYNWCREEGIDLEECTEEDVARLEEEYTDYLYSFCGFAIYDNEEKMIEAYDRWNGIVAGEWSDYESLDY